jgi:hypothetical protein
LFPPPDKVTRDQVAEETFVPRHPHFPSDNERHTVDTFAMLYQVLAYFRSGPGSDAQNLQYFPRWQIAECEPANVLFFWGQFDRTRLDEKTPRLE